MISKCEGLMNQHTPCQRAKPNSMHRQFIQNSSSDAPADSFPGFISYPTIIIDILAVKDHQLKHDVFTDFLGVD
jgi:hypothetical protein